MMMKMAKRKMTKEEKLIFKKGNTARIEITVNTGNVPMQEGEETAIKEALENRIREFNICVDEIRVYR